jgi:ABC-type ATPase involved in cell division
VLRLTAVTLRHQGQTLLDAVTMEARAGELLVVEGGRAAGKTLLLEIAGARRRPDSGTVCIADHDLTALQRDSLPFVRRNVGFVESQPCFVSGMSVLDNVMLVLGARDEPVAWAREAALRALGKVGAVGLATARTETLSSSARRLTGIARALAGSPPVLLLDDPSASLTAADTGAVLSALLGAVASGAVAVCASADGAFTAAAVRAGARRLRLEGGRLLAGPMPMSVVAGGRAFDRPPASREALP